MARTATYCTIHGRVQGVGYRAWTKRRAADLALDGWVRNLPDGTVEAVFAGDDASVLQMVDSCRKGPLFAKVIRVDQKQSDDPGTIGFTIR